MAETLVMTSTVGVKLEDTYKTNPVLTSANVIEVVDIDVNPEWNSVKPGGIANTKSERADILTDSVGQGSVTINLKGCQTPGTAPEGDPLFECAVGVKNVSTQSVTAAGSTATSIVLAAGGGTGFAVGDCLAIICPTTVTYTTAAGSTTTSIVLSAAPSNFSVGDIIQVPNGDGSTLIEATRITAINSATLTVFPALTAAPNASQTVKKATISPTWVTNKATDTLTVSPAVAAAPDAKTRVRAGVHYKLTTADLKSFWMSFWRGNVTREDYGGSKIDSLEFDITSGGIILPKFSFKAAYTGHVPQAYGLGAPSLNTLDPIVGVSQYLKIGGTSIDTDKFQFRINNTIYDRKSIVTQGISKRIHTKRNVECSFDLLYENDDLLDALEAGTKFEAVIVMGRNGFINGNMVALRIPQLRYTKVPASADNDLWKYSVTAVADKILGEDELSSLSFL
jgi:hypothetical protein